MYTRHFLIGILCLTLLAGCTDLSFLDDAVSEGARDAAAPELQPAATLDLEAQDPAEFDTTAQVLKARQASLQRRAAELR